MHEAIETGTLTLDKEFLIKDNKYDGFPVDSPLEPSKITPIIDEDGAYIRLDYEIPPSSLERFPPPKRTFAVLDINKNFLLENPNGELTPQRGNVEIKKVVDQSGKEETIERHKKLLYGRLNDGFADDYAIFGHIDQKGSSIVATIGGEDLPLGTLHNPNSKNPIIGKRAGYGIHVGEDSTTITVNGIINEQEMIPGHTASYTFDGISPDVVKIDDQRDHSRLSLQYVDDVRFSSSKGQDGKLVARIQEGNNTRMVPAAKDENGNQIPKGIQVLAPDYVRLVVVPSAAMKGDKVQNLVRVNAKHLAVEIDATAIVDPNLQRDLADGPQFSSLALDEKGNFAEGVFGNTRITTEHNNVILEGVATELGKDIPVNDVRFATTWRDALGEKQSSQAFMLSHGNLMTVANVERHEASRVMKEASADALADKLFPGALVDVAMAGSGGDK
ncbi:MAG: hypothetical protein MPJ50_02485 [Pirellulales bacterium]|nr:hypothetical protein [Pirellulales bacterium]